MHISPYSRAPISVSTTVGKRTRRRVPTCGRRRGALRRLSLYRYRHRYRCRYRCRYRSGQHTGAVILIRVTALTSSPCRPARAAAARSPCAACIAACRVCARKLAAHPAKSLRSLRMQAAFLERSRICIHPVIVQQLVYRYDVVSWKVVTLLQSGRLAPSRRHPPLITSYSSGPALVSVRARPGRTTH